jgi:hypothetical protein
MLALLCSSRLQKPEASPPIVQKNNQLNEKVQLAQIRDNAIYL